LVPISEIGLSTVPNENGLNGRLANVLYLQFQWRDLITDAEVSLDGVYANYTYRGIGAIQNHG
jgi:hypothetical protein